MNLKDVNQQRLSDQSPPNGAPVEDDGHRSGEVGVDFEIVSAAGKDTQRPTGGQNTDKPERALAVLGRDRSVIVVGRDLTLDSWIKTVQEALAKARRAKTYGLQLESFLNMLRDMARG